MWVGHFAITDNGRQSVVGHSSLIQYGLYSGFTRFHFWPGSVQSGIAQAIDARRQARWLEHIAVGEIPQVAAIADDVAYNHHDLHDGLRAELFSTDELADLPILSDTFAEVDRLYPGLNYYRRRHEALRRFFGILVEDVINDARARLAEIDPSSPDDIRHAGRPLIRFSDPVFADLKVIRDFLFQRMYRAPSVVEMRAQVTQVVHDLFPYFMAHPEDLPKQWRKDVEEAADETALARIVCDYISGMTDRFALQSHARLVGGDDPAPR